MLFSEFAKALNALESISKRLEITALLAKVYRELEVEEVQPASYLLLGSLRPDYDSLEFQMSAKMVLRSLAELRSSHSENGGVATDLFGTKSIDTDLEYVTALFGQLGDVGLVAERVGAEGSGVLTDATSAVRRPGLGVSVAQTSSITLTGVGSSADTSTIAGPTGIDSSAVTTTVAGSAGVGSSADKPSPSILAVFESLNKIAGLAGTGSQEQKVTQLRVLLASLDPIGAKFVCRMVVGKMRLGFSIMTIMDALSWSVHNDKRDHEKLEEAFQQRADIGYLAKVYLSAGSEAGREKALATYSMVPGTPVVPQLCQRLASPAEVVEKMTTVFAEPKYDGLRAQIHIWTENSTKKVRVFTRSLEDVTHMFPEAVSAATLLDVDSAVFDSEAIGFHPDTGELLPFQETITRKRKHAVAETAQSVPIRFYIFDLLFLNGESYLDKPLRERKSTLINTISNSEYISVTKHLESGDPQEIQTFHESQLSGGLEGVVLKQPDAPYRGGRKGWHWVKLKELAGTRGKLKDTLDCVVMGYYPGQGKRTQFGIGAFLVGVLSGEEFVTIAKIGTGLTDEQFREIKALCDPHRSEVAPSRFKIPKGLTPSVFVEPQVVVEIAADEITNSPVHTAGVALRFPRMVRIRSDKTPEQITTLGEVRELV